ncbi:MAG: AsmA family protein, partial [Betaproteobacteria bacterium]
MATRSSLLRWLAGIALLLIALYAFGEWRMWPWARAPLERWLAGTVQREIAIGGDFGLRTLGAVTLQSDRLVLGGPKAGPHPPERAQAPEFLRAERLRLVMPYATLFALWRGTREPLRVRSLDVERLALALVREADGSANWTFGADKPASGEPAIPRFDRLIVQSARVWIDDAVPDLSLVVNLQTREGVALADSGKNGLEAQAEGSFRGLPLEATARSSGVLPIAAGAGAPAVPLRLWLKVADNTLDLDGTVRDLMQLSALDAEFRLAGSSLGAVGDAIGVSLPTTPPFRAQGRVSKDGAVWQSTVAAFVIGSSRLEGDFSYDPGIAPPLLAGSLRGKRLALSDLGPAVTSVGPVERKAPAANERRQRGRVLPRQPFNLPALDAMQAEVDVDLDRLDLGA